MHKFVQYMLLTLVVTSDLVACGAAEGRDAGEASESVGQALGGSLCCIDYWCPTNPDIEFTGCKSGGQGPGSAARACGAQCSVPCQNSGFICQ